MVRFVLALLLLLAGISGLRAQTAVPAAPTAPAAPSAAGVPAAEAQKALAVLKDPAKLAELIAVLEAMAKAKPAEAAPVLPLAPDSVGAQLLMDSSRRIASLTDDLMATVRTVTDFPLLARFVQDLMSDPWSRGMLLSAGWRLVVVFAAGLAAHWLVRRALARPRAVLAGRGQGRRTDEAEAGTRRAMDAAEAGATEPPTRPPLAVLGIVRRSPMVLGRLVLLLLPVVAFLAAGYALLGAGLGTDATSRLVILGLMNAYAITRVASAVLRCLTGPGEPRLFLVPDEAADYVRRWTGRMVAVGVYGYAIAEIGLLFGLYRIAHDALIKLAALAICLMLAAVVLQQRGRVAGWIRTDGETHGVFAALRTWFASIWHFAAIFYLLALWTVWALDVPGGFSRLLRLVLISAVIILLGRLAHGYSLRLATRWTKVPADLAQRYPGLDSRVGSYHPAARVILGVLVGLATLVALAEAWGYDAVGWFAGDRLGARLMGALGTIAATLILALVVWELVNAAIQRHLDRLAREAQLARSARLRTLLPMLRTTVLVCLCVVAGLMVLSAIGINIAPLLAGAGVVGLAIGFGSQKLVQDIITGLFLLLENAMQVGDVVDLGGPSGLVEALSVRTIRLRAGDGSVHIVPFSAVTKVTNMNRDFGFAVFEFWVGLNEEPDRIIEIIKAIAREMREDEAWKDIIRDDVEIWGVDKFVPNAWILQGRIMTTPLGRWGVRRELNRRVKLRFDELKIDSPMTSWQARGQAPAAVMSIYDGRS
jgi:small-conductance mechanosensitive channel